MISLNLEDMVWEKYQGLCPYCGVEKNCMCITQDKRPMHWFQNPNGTRPTSLDGFQEMFNGIYGKLNRLLPHIAVWLHLQEEIGETSRAFRLLERQGLQMLRNELADVFAWLMAFCNRLQVKLSVLTYDVYPDICDTCRKPRCECPKV